MQAHPWYPKQYIFQLHYSVHKMNTPGLIQVKECNVNTDKDSATHMTFLPNTYFNQVVHFI